MIKESCAELWSHWNKILEKDMATASNKEQVRAAVRQAAVQEDPMDPEADKKNKEKELISLRDKLQNGLLKPMQRPKRNDMKYMSHCISKLEEYPDFKASVIRSTKINRVIKSIAKLEHIPRENKFNFKDRCTELLAKYSKTLQKDLKSHYINDPDFVPSTQTFHLFGELPPQLKTMTWKCAAKDYAAAIDWTDCRTHATKFGLDLLSLSRDGEMLSKLAIPPLLRISRLSREIIWDTLHRRCFWAACEREVKTRFGPWSTYPGEEWETEEKTLEAKEEFEEEGVDKQIGRMFFLYFGEKRDTMKTGDVLLFRILG